MKSKISCFLRFKRFPYVPNSCSACLGMLGHALEYISSYIWGNILFKLHLKFKQSKSILNYPKKDTYVECLNCIYLHLLRLHISTSCSNIYIQETGFGSCPTNLFPNSMFGLFVLDIISYTSLYCAWKDGTTSYCITGDIQYLPKWGVKYCYTVYIFIIRL